MTFTFDKHDFGKLNFSKKIENFSMMKFFFWIFTGGLHILAEDKSDIISRWAADLQVEYKVSSLSRLLSYSLSVNAVSILNFGGVWLTQQSPTSTHALNVARHLVGDMTATQHPHLDTLPSQERHVYCI